MRQRSLGVNITEAEQTLGALLRAPYQILAARVYGELAARGFAEIRPAHSAVFRHIAPEGSRTTELAERAQMTKQSMGYLVEYLRARGYVELQPDPSDGRARLVCLTDRGRAVQQAALEISRRLERELAEEIGEAEMRRLRELLQALARRLEHAKPGRDNSQRAIQAIPMASHP